MQALGRSIDDTLRGYADRGVFRGFSADDGAGGVRRYRFLWLTRRPMTVTLSRDRRALTFTALLPLARSVPKLGESVRREVQALTSPERPKYRRLDERRVTISPRSVNGDFALRVSIKSEQRRAGEYAVRSALGVVNELFLFLHEMYPDYLAAHFGVSQE